MAWWNRKKKPEQKPERTDVVSQENRTGFFSTGNDLSIPRITRWIARHAIPKGAPVPVMQKGVAFDAASDSFSSIKAAFNMGSAGALPEALFGWYVSQGFIGYQACSIIAQQWLVDKACTVAPQDAIRKGYEITINSDDEIPAEALDRLKQIDVEHKITKQLVEFAKFNRVFGIRIALFHVDSSDPDYYTKPFNPDGVTVGLYKGFSQVDPFWVTPELDAEAAANPASRHFYEPTWWRINGKRYHRSHLVIIRTSEVSDILKPSYIYGGIPLPQKICERVYAAERTANEAPLLALTKRTTVMKVDMDAAIADQGSFEENLATWINYRDNYGVKVCGLNEEMNQTDTALGDLDALIMTQYQIVAAIANTPATKLLGTQPKGFNSTGDYEESVYHEYLESIQANEMQPLLERHHLLSIRSDAEIAKILQGKSAFTVEINWKPLDSMTENEAADVQYKKAQTDQILQMAGAISSEEIRGRVIADKLSGYNGVDNVDSDDDIDSDTDNWFAPSGDPATTNSVENVQQPEAMGEAGNGFVMKGKPVMPTEVSSLGE